MSMFGHQVTGWKKIITHYLFISGKLLSLFIIFYSCAKNPDNLGRDLLPSSDNIVVKIDSSTLISSYTIDGKHIPTSANELYVLGSQKDSIFGLGSASILTRFHPARLISADSIRMVDSLVLYLSSASYFGDTLSQLTLRIYELDQNQKLTTDTTGYYSDINPAEYCSLSSELANTTFTIKDSLIRIKITDPGFINKFETIPDSVFLDLIDFEQQFPGLYLSVDQVTENGGYTYLNMSSVDTRLMLYYNGDSISDEYEMSFTSIAAKANVFSHEYPGFPIANHIDSPDSKDSLMFIDGLAGARGRISFPQLDDWKSKGLITINKAELILPVDTLMYPSLSEENYPPKLFLWALGDDGSTYEPIYDIAIDQTGTYYGGSYDKIQKAYVFKIGLHLQSYISGKIKYSDLVLVSRNANSAANRVILKGATSLHSPIKLRVIYTELF